MRLFAKKQAPIVEHTEPPTQPVPSDVVVDLSEARLARYKEQAEKLNFYPAELKREELMQFLKARQRGVYDYKEVRAFLNSEFGEAKGPTGQTWSWRPLTETDAGQTHLENSRFHAKNGTFELPPSYEGKVPFEVLERVEELKNALPFAYFFVSDILRSSDRFQGDPFLAVTWPGLDEMIVIEQWDEPNFFGTSKVPE